MDARSDATAPSGADNPQEARACSRCDEIVILSPETWPHHKNRKGIYAPHGTYCLVCEKVRKAQYEERRKSIANAAADVPVPHGGTTEQTRKAVSKASRLDVAQALKAGSVAINQLAPGVMARIMEYLEDPEHKHHLWALELLAQRILPRKLYEELGGQAAGVGSLESKRPMFVLQVLPAQSGGATGNTYDEQGNLLLAAPAALAQGGGDEGQEG